MPPARAKVVLLDTNGLIYRAFYALPYLTTSEGRPTNAVYGFTTMLLKVLEEVRPDYIVAAFDRPEPTFRHKAYAEYKAHREAMPDDLRPQMGLSKQVLETLRIPSVDAPGYEADDVIATLARQAEAQGMEVVVVSGDLDTLQLVDENVRVMVTSRGITETVVYDEARVRERFGFTPAQLTDYKSLRGDPSDNIPGIPGIGEKTASALVQQFGSVEELLEHVDKAPARHRQALEAARDQLLRSKSLATLISDVPLSVDWESLRRQEPDHAAVDTLFRALEFRGLLDRMREAARQAIVRSRDGNSIGALGLANPAADGVGLSTPDVTVRHEGALAVADCVSGAGSIGIALLPGALEPASSSIRAVGVATENSAAWMMVGSDGMPDPLRRIIEDSAVKKISGDVKADLVMLRTFGLVPAGFDFDVAIASYVLNPGRRTHTLATAAREFLDVDLDAMGSLDDDSPPSLAADAAVALVRLRPILEARMRERSVDKLFTDVEVPLADVLARMEQAGVTVDVPYLTALGSEIEQRIADLESTIYKLAGSEFNIGSPKQLAFVLFEKLQLPPLKRTKTGFSTDADVLESLAPRHEVVAKILQHRELTKLKSTYIDVLPRLADPGTHRVHTNFNQTYAATGRLSSENPNLQNIPIRSEEGRRIRRAIVAPSGMALLSVDYSQIDLRVLAHITRDPALVGAFERSEDIHTVTAAQVFGVPAAEVSAELRRRAKVIVFGVAYGMSEYGLAAQLAISREEARAFIEQYYARFPLVRAYMLRVVEEARRDGFVTTVLNRRRYLPDLMSRNRQVREAAERTAINTPIQGSSADIIKVAMLDIARDVIPTHPGVQMTLQVHDELLFEVPEADVAQVAAHVRTVMEAAVPLSVPIVADASAGPNWASMRRIA
jgi:DNA polymerase-1